MFELSVGGVMIRFYVMMAIVIGSVLSGQSWFAILALPVLLSIMLGVKFKS